MAVHGTRGDIEPCAAVARELQRRGHLVRMAVPPNLIGFAESAGLGGVQPYGPDSQQQLQAQVFRDWWRPRNPITVLRQAREYVSEGWAEMSETLTALSDDADLILTGTTYEELAANVAERGDIPLAALHYFPARPNTVILPIRIPPRVAAAGWSIAEWVHWRTLKPAEDRQRQALGLPRARSRAIRRIAERGALEIQAYDEALFPGLAEQWQGRRHFVGSITLALPTEYDAAVQSWAERGAPPIYFGFGSMPVHSPAETVTMITEVCSELGRRALICSDTPELRGIPVTDDVMVVPAVNHASIFEHCRAVVHHGGAGTTAAAARAGVPVLVLWVGADQPLWANQIRRLGVGTSRRLASTTRQSLRDDLVRVLTPDYARRAARLASRMTPPAQSLAATADLLERAAGGPC